MVPVEPISLSIGIATLFTSCIECFEYFKAAKGFQQNFEVLLVKLEYQQERLLVWGDLVGIGTGGHHGLEPDSETNERTQDVTKRCLTSIQRLLKDAETLKSKYGLRSYTATSDTAPHSGISSNALKRLRLRLGRQSKGPSVLDKTRWAIHDEPNFQKLVEDIRGLIDGLMSKVPVSSDLQEQKVRDDIASMVDDIQSLHLFQEACKDDYPEWWTAASAAIDASEVATIDNRLANEYVDHYVPSVSGIPGVGDGVPRIPTHFGDGKVHIDSNVHFWFMLTGSCRAQDTETPCDQLRVGEMSFNSKYSFIAPGSFRTGSAPGYRITRHIDPSRFTNADLENYIETREKIVAHSLATAKPVPEEDGRYRVRVYIYCPPCACQIATALDICQFSDKKSFVEFYIRIDNQKMCSCAVSVSGIHGLISVMDFVKSREAETYNSDYAVNRLKNIDRDWLERVIYNYAEEHLMSTLSPTNQLARIAEFHVNEKSCAAIIQLGEADYCVPLMRAPPFPPFEPGQLPKETELYRICQQSRYVLSRGPFWTWEREYMGTYTQRAPLPSRQPPLARPDTSHAAESMERRTKRPRSSTSDEAGP